MLIFSHLLVIVGGYALLYHTVRCFDFRFFFLQLRFFSYSNIEGGIYRRYSSYHNSCIIYLSRRIHFGGMRSVQCMVSMLKNMIISFYGVVDVRNHPGVIILTIKKKGAKIVSL